MLVSSYFDRNSQADSSRSGCGFGSLTSCVLSGDPSASPAPCLPFCERKAVVAFDTPAVNVAPQHELGHSINNVRFTFQHLLGPGPLRLCPRPDPFPGLPPPSAGPSAPPAFVRLSSSGPPMLFPARLHSWPCFLDLAGLVAAAAPNFTLILSPSSQNRSLGVRSALCLPLLT